jgi:CDP-glycerol glycerophosphotransferase (TagB/SpsB family)
VTDAEPHPTSEVGDLKFRVRRSVSLVRPALYRLAQRLLDVRFELARSYGGGEARVFAVMGEAFREQFLRQGVRKERIEVTGHPLHDSAFELRACLTPERVGELKERYDLPSGSRVIVYATQPVLWRAVITRHQLVENVRALGASIAELGPDFLLVLKLHPRERLEDYAGVQDGRLPIRLLKDTEIAPLIGLAEAFISSSSSTVLLAMMLGKPIVTVNFNQVPHFDYFESVGGTLHARTPAEAAEALRRALFDQATSAALNEQRTAVLARYARFDGQATHRLADLVEAISG